MIFMPSRDQVIAGDRIKYELTDAPGVEVMAVVVKVSKRDTPNQQLHLKLGARLTSVIVRRDKIKSLYRFPWEDEAKRKHKLRQLDHTRAYEAKLKGATAHG